jgi:hypothetical protein
MHFSSPFFKGFWQRIAKAILQLEKNPIRIGYSIPKQKELIPDSHIAMWQGQAGLFGDQELKAVTQLLKLKSKVSCSS